MMNGALQFPIRTAGPVPYTEVVDQRRLARPTDSIHETIHRGQEAWIRLRSDNTWADWVAVGKAHVIGHTEAMREAGVNKPNGHRFDKAFSAWRKRFGFDSLDKGDRSRLFKLMDNLAAIEAWRATLTTTERLKLNHPNSVLRKWQAATSVARSRHPEGEEAVADPETQSVARRGARGKPQAQTRGGERRRRSLDRERSPAGYCPGDGEQAFTHQGRQRCPGNVAAAGRGVRQRWRARLMANDEDVGSDASGIARQSGDQSPASGGWHR
jgi:hypothetical protein